MSRRYSLPGGPPCGICHQPRRRIFIPRLRGGPIEVIVCDTCDGPLVDASPRRPA